MDAAELLTMNQVQNFGLISMAIPFSPLLRSMQLADRHDDNGKIPGPLQLMQTL
jgi:hypothetical protein